MARTGRRRTTAAEMAPLVAAWRRGAGTQAQIAARAGMPSSTFAWWCQRLGGGALAPFVAVDVLPEPAAPTPAAGACEALEVVLGNGARVRVPTGFDEPGLRRLLAVLEERPC